MSKRARCRVLTLDGGGINGAFTAGVLAQFEETLGRRVVDHFDLIVGTSTGGILAIGLGMGIPAKEIEKMYCERGREIFGADGYLERSTAVLRHFFRPKHQQENLRKVLLDVLGERKLGDSLVRLVIPTFDSSKGTACTFKTAHHERLRYEYDKPAVDIAIATASAPTYFSAASIRDRQGIDYIDGGVWANDPVLVGIVEAVHFLGRPLSEIDVLSVGTTNELIYFSQNRHAGLFGWSKYLINVLMAGQATAAQAQARLLVGDRLQRINLPVPEKIPMDRASNAQSLAGRGRSVARAEGQLKVARERFLNGIHVEPFVSIYR
ncbi:CBASS cGAMP-activated phospholipase [Paraburkholderia sediminicola]|uniref:CBASS cGAMP-activated phospholipase n=1 Tax=Paraburkholderia sediminicola TaxID=458836 RepID=UPI0038B847A7